MKKIISFALVAVLCHSFLVACGGGPIANGTYANKDGQEIVVKGNTMSMVETEGEDSVKMTYTYEVNDDKTKITLTFDKVEYDGDKQEIKDSIKEMEEAMAKEDAKTQELGIEITDNAFTLDYGHDYKVTFTKK